MLNLNEIINRHKKESIRVGARLFTFAPYHLGYFCGEKMLLEGMVGIF